MKTLATSLRAVVGRLWRSDNDALAAYRGRIAAQLCLLAAVLLVPFSIANTLNDNLAIGVVGLVTIAVLAANGWALRSNRNVPVPFWMMTLLAVVTVIWTILAKGHLGTVWSYPALFIAYFLLPRKQAQLMSLLLLLGVVWAAAWTTGGWALSTRLFASLGLTCVMINVVLNVVGELQEALVAQATTDPLTGAYNRRHFVTQLAALPAPRPGSGAQNVLLALDVDHFKAINDSYGHFAGDAVLSGLVGVLNKRLRSNDRLFGTGGEEFVLLLPRITLKDAEHLAEDLRTRVAQVRLVPGHPEHQVTISIGVSAHRSGASVDDWHRATDKAMYEAKNGGRNRVVLAT